MNSNIAERVAANLAGEWVVPENLDTTGFDFSWRPSPSERPYIHQFGTQWQKTGGPRFVVPGNEGVKYHDFQRAKMLPNPGAFRVLVDTDVEFDWSWHPDETDPPFTYVFGNQYLDAEVMPTVEYNLRGGGQIKYVNDIRAKLVSRREHWVLHRPIYEEDFDFTWHPHPWEPPYIHVWGNQWHRAEEMATVEYYAPGATERKYMEDKRARLRSNPEYWTVHDRYINSHRFYFNWAPPPYDPPYIYAWGNKWIPAEVQPTITYTVPGATEYKYMPALVELIPVEDAWVKFDSNCIFDYTWRPNPHEPPYIYVWGNKWVPAEVAPTLEYHVPGATVRKYMPEPVEVTKQQDRWVTLNVDVASFDYTWRPNPREPAYIYVWGNKWVPGELESTLEYHVPGATERKYMPEPVEVLPDWGRWKILQEVDRSKFDFSWRPDPREPAYIYVWGNKWVPAEVGPTLEYHVPGATERKYMHELVTVSANYENWKQYQLVDQEKFDFSWRPDPTSPPYIYVWGNKWVTGDMEPTLEYHVIGATERKYMPEPVEVLPQLDRWKKLLPVDESNFDFTWRPDPREPAYIYVWGNQHHSSTVEPTVEYHTPGATERKYIDSTVATVLPNYECFKLLIPNVEFDYTWRPDPGSPPYIYVWGNQWNGVKVEPTLEYRVPGAVDYKYMEDIVARVPQTKENWKILIEGATFDYSWRPDPREPAYIYVWGNKWNSAAVEPTVEYHTPGATERKYMDNMVAILPPTEKNWTTHTSEDLLTFDYSWRPNPGSPPQIYQWEDGGPTYTVPGATEVVLVKRTTATGKDIPRYYITTTLNDLAAEHCNEVFWALNPDLNYDRFDFSWKPSAENFRHINVFGNEYSKDTQTYWVNGPLYKLGYREFNYVEDQIVEVDSNLGMFYVDTGVADCSVQFNILKERYPQLQKTRFTNSWVDTITRCIKKSNTELFWVLSSELDYSDFQFTFYPGKWQKGMLHVFGTQYSHWGNTYLVNSSTFPADTKYVKVVEHLKNINHVRGIKAKTAAIKHDILYIEHGNTNGINSSILHGLGRKVYTIEYKGSYLQTIKEFIGGNPDLTRNPRYHIWVTSSVCDYTDFDFTWQGDPFQNQQLHVFASEYGRTRQKFGDTFLMNLHEFRENSTNLSSLEDYTNKVNYIGWPSVKRQKHPVLVHRHDSHVDALDDLGADYYPYYELQTADVAGGSAVVPNLWTSETPVVVGTRGASQIYIPNLALKQINGEIYDYPYVDNAGNLGSSKPLDIIFISNGEPAADENYGVLVDSLKKRGLPNKVSWVKNVDGRIASQHAAANASTTGWYFLVNGKIRANNTFDWLWQPDRLQKAKHYIFTAENPVNGLIYGHQAVVANNRALTLATASIKGLDFTLDSLHEVVDMVCGVAVYNTDQWTTWRTAFRESIKLRNNSDRLSKFRLDRWLDNGTGNYAEWSQRGALDGVEYWESVDGNLEKLLLSYDWNWIKGYYGDKYGN